jgi:glycosyltransferase involved in cell wall biosynthesis
MTGDRPLRVVLVISNLEYGGAQRQVVEVTNAVDPSRVDVIVCSLSSFVPLADTLHRRDRLRVIPKRFKYDMTVIPRLARLLREYRADVVHSYLFDADIATRVAGRIASTALVVGSERNTDYTLKKVQRGAYRLTRGLVDLIIANSHAGAAFNSRLLGYDASMYEVLHNGVDAARFHPGDRSDVRRELGIADTTPVVGMFASFKEQKNHPLFFAAARRLLADIPDTRLLLVGDELYAGMHGSHDYKAGIDRSIDELGLRANTIALGNRRDVERLYPACDVTVLPSLFEGTPNVALESMACGVPVVITDVADNRLIVPDGEAGYVVPLGDAEMLADRLKALLADEPLRTRMGRTAREWIERRFSSERLAERTEVIYRKALSRSGGKSGRVAVTS